jgi:Mg2+ and Co2+ transporter CorA
MTDNTDDPQGRDASDRTERSHVMADELLHGMLMRDLFAALGWDRHGRSFNDAIAHIKSLVAGAGQDVAALRAEVERLRDESSTWERVYKQLEKSVYDQAQAEEAYMREVQTELATLRKRIAAAEAMADRWQTDAYGAPHDYDRAQRDCARELRAALTGDDECAGS